MSFWDSLPKPIVGLSPMDGVTDAAMREITATYGKPDILMTEFTSADGIMHGVTKLLRDFYFTDQERPIIAQIFGANPQMFRLCAVIVCELGFDGLDINMGCPAPSIATKGGGASLILNPPLAKELVRAAKNGVEDWVNGKTIEDLGLEDVFVRRVKKFAKSRSDRKAIPVSVKTRLGYDKIVTTEWIPHLLEVEPVTISIHGRILTQYHSGEVNWEEIAKAAQLIHQTPTLVLGNGDVGSPQEIVDRVKESGVDGVLIGRAAMGNPWFFSQWKQFQQGKSISPISIEERFQIAIEHAKMFELINTTAFLEDPLPFLNMRKHLGWYIKGMRDATELRSRIFQTNSSDDVIAVLTEYTQSHPLA